MKGIGENMKKTITRVITMLLVLAMLLGMSATTVIAAGDSVGGSQAETGNQSAPIGDSLVTGWCDISYDENGVLVVITPDKEAILGISKEQLKQIVAIAVDAAKALVINDMKEQILENLNPAPSGSLDASGVTIDNVWEMAIDGYIAKKYPASTDPLIDFFKDAVADKENKIIGGFIDYACELLVSAVSMNLIDPEKLPEASKIEETVTKVFDKKVDEYINTTVDNYVSTYVDWILNGDENDPNPIKNDDVRNFINNQIKDYVDNAVSTYVSNGFSVPADATLVQSVVGDYLTKQIKLAIDTAAKNYANNDLAANDKIHVDINIFIESEIQSWVDGIVDAWPEHPTGANPLDKLAHDQIAAKMDEYVLSLVNEYFAGTLTDSKVIALIEKEINDRAPEYMESYYWAHRDDAVKPTYAWFSAIDSELEKAVKAEIEKEILKEYPSLAGSDLDNAVNTKYGELSTDGIKGYMKDYSISLSSYISDQIKTFSRSDWKVIWDGLEATDRNDILHLMEQDLIDSDAIKDKIEAEWSDPDVRHGLMQDFINSTIYSEVIDDIFADAAKNATYKHLIQDEIDKRIKDVDTIVKTLRSMLAELKANDKAKYDSIVSAIEKEVNAAARSEKVIDAAYNSVLDMNKATVNARVDEFVDLFVVDYKATVEDLLAEPPVLDYSDLVQYLDSVEINGFKVFANGTFSLSAVKALVLDLVPTFNEIANMSNDEMLISIDAKITTTFNTSTEFNATAKLAGGHDLVRKYAALAAEYIDIGFENNELTLDVRVPAKLASLLLKAANSPKVPDSLKKKVFAACTKTPDDVYAFVNDITFDEFLELLDYVDFEELFDSKYLSKFEKLDGLTNEQIKEKARQYEKYFNKVLDLVKKVYPKVPESVKDKNLMSFYRGEGEFSYAGSHSVSFDLEAILSKISEKYGPLIASFFDISKISMSVDLCVTFENINSVEFKLGEQTIGKGFLPVGADLAFFAGVTVYEGDNIIGWSDAEGNVYTKMPDKDVVLTPVTDHVDPPVIPDVKVQISDGITKVFDGNEYTLTVTVDYPYMTASPVFTYQWYKGGEAIDGANSVTYTVKDVVDSGSYYCEVHVVDGLIDDTYTSNSVIVSITPAALDLSGYTWSPSEPFVYDGEEHEVILVDKDGNSLEGVAYSGNKAVNAGTYVARVEVLDASNYDVTIASYEFEWTIERADYDMSAVKFNNKRVVYTGSEQTIVITGQLPDGVRVEYENNVHTEPGKYTAIAKFYGDDNHNEIESMSAVLYIVGFTKDFSYRDSNGNLILTISALNGVLETYQLNFKNVTNRYNYLEDEEVFGEGKVGYVVGAYDIHFTEEGTEQPVNDQFAVSLLLPESLRGASDKQIMLVYVDENGNVQNMNATISGDYVKFDTTHFSVYAIVEVADAPADAEDLDLTWLWILLAVLAVLIIVAIIVIIVLRKRKGNEPEEPNEAPTDEPESTDDSGAAVVTEEPATEAPAEEPVTEVPAEEPATEAPVEEPVTEAPVEEPATEAPAEEPAPAPAPTRVIPPVITLKGDDDEEGGDTIINGQVVHVRYRSSFMSRLIQSEEPIQDYYTVVKNKLLSYKGVKARLSWNFESFNKGRIQCAKLNVKGKNFMVYLGLDPNEYNVNKYHFVDVSDKPKLDKVPMMLKIKSERGLKYAIELIEEVMRVNEIEATDIPEVDYHMPYETTTALAARDLVKVILPPGVSLDDADAIVEVNVGALIDNASTDKDDVKPEPVAPAPVVEEIMHVDAVHADEIVTDEQAREMIEVVTVAPGEKGTGKVYEINIDVICENFNDGDVVTPAILKERRLINRKAGRVKILARGVMTKTLTIYADKFSLQAVKMITLAGGHAEQYK